MRQGQLVDIFHIIRRMDNHFVEVRYRIFVLDYPNLPASLVRRTCTNSINFFPRQFLESRAKHAYLIDINADWRLARPLGPGFRKNYPPVRGYIWNVLSHKISLSQISFSDNLTKTSSVS